MLIIRFKFAAVLVSLAAACSSPSENGEPNASTTDVGADLGVDVGNDVTVVDEPDVGAFDFGSPIYPVLEETEPNTQTDQATAFTQPAVLTGNVNLDDDAFDWWEVHLAGPAIVRLSIEAGDVGWVEFQTPLAGKRGLYGGPGTTREFFVPTSNRYQVGILATEDNPDVDYRVVVESYEATPIPLTELSVTGDLEDGKVDVYAWTSMGAGFTVVEVLGQRPPVSSSLDSFLFVYDDSLNRFDWNDDASSGGTKDSRLDYERRDGAEYLIAVDMYEPTDDRRYELRLQAN